jgi:hypothetical protein
MVMSGGTLVSECHDAIIYMEGEKYICGHCLKPCNSAGTLSEKHERDNAISAEHARLKDAVVEKAKEFTSDEEARDNWNALVAYRELCGVVDALIAFEAEHKIGE